DVARLAAGGDDVVPRAQLGRDRAAQRAPRAHQEDPHPERLTCRHGLLPSGLSMPNGSNRSGALAADRRAGHTDGPPPPDPLARPDHYRKSASVGQLHDAAGRSLELRYWREMSTPKSWANASRTTALRPDKE